MYFHFTTEGSIVNKRDLAVYLGGTYCHKNGTRPPCCQLLENRLFMPAVTFQIVLHSKISRLVDTVRVFKVYLLHFYNLNYQLLYPKKHNYTKEAQLYSKKQNYRKECSKKDSKFWKYKHVMDFVDLKSNLALKSNKSHNLIKKISTQKIHVTLLKEEY